MNKKKRLLIDIDEEIHKNIKKLAAERNTSIRKYVTRFIKELIDRDKKYLKDKN